FPAEALKLVAAAANAPIYGFADSFMGSGIVGGHVLSFEMEGKHAADLALRILAGERPEQISVTGVSPNVAMFDWRQLRRWGINTASLPPGSDVRFREPSLDRKSTRLNSSHVAISYAVFCLKKKMQNCPVV